MIIKALVATRSGSERVANKNMRLFSGKTLLEYKLEQLTNIQRLDGVVLNSNDDEMLDLARKLGCEVVKRNEFYASSTISMNDCYVNMAENFSGDIVVYCNTTSPLITCESINRAVDLYFQHKNVYNSVNSAHLIKEFMWMDGRSLNYNPAFQPRSQDLPDIYSINFAVSVISRKDMINERTIVSPRCKLLPISSLEAIDIDTMLDFEIAEYLFNKHLANKLY